MARSRPSRARPMRLTERDEQLLHRLARYGFLSTPQLTRDLFPTENRARRRLRKAFDAGLVRKHLVDSQCPDIYAITSLGLGELRSRGRMLDRVRPPRRAPAFATMTHQLMLADALLYAEATTQASDRLAGIEWARGRSALARAAGFDVRRLVPDALAVFTLPSGGAWTVSIEADAGTEPLSTWRRKLAAYQPLLQSRRINELWVILERTAGRDASLAALVSTTTARSVRIFPHPYLYERPTGSPVAVVEDAYLAQPS